MTTRQEVLVPDIGEFTDVEIVEVMVDVGDVVAVEDSLITIETDKAAMDVPAPVAGKVLEMSVSLGDKVSEGSLILVLEAQESVAAAVPAEELPETPTDNDSTAHKPEADKPVAVTLPPVAATGKLPPIRVWIRESRYCSCQPGKSDAESGKREFLVYNCSLNCFTSSAVIGMAMTGARISSKITSALPSFSGTSLRPYIR